MYSQHTVTDSENKLLHINTVQCNYCLLHTLYIIVSLPVITSKAWFSNTPDVENNCNCSHKSTEWHDTSTVTVHPTVQKRLRKNMTSKEAFLPAENKETWNRYMLKKMCTSVKSRSRCIWSHHSNLISFIPSRFTFSCFPGTIWHDCCHLLSSWNRKKRLDW